MQKRIDLNRIATSFLPPFVILIIVLFPYAPSTFLQYGLWPAYFALLIFIIAFFPMVIFKSASYWNNEITFFLWVVRFLALLDFFVYGLMTSISNDDVISILGTLFLTFYYEMGYFMVSAGYLKRIIKYWIWLNTIICIIILPYLFYIYIAGGIGGVINMNLQIHKYIFNWPNEFGLAIAIAFFLSIYSIQANRRYLISMIMIASVILFTDAKGATFGFLVAIFIIIANSIKQKKVFSYLLFIFIIFTSVYVIYSDKNLPGGSRIEHSYEMRYVRWQTYFSVWEESPLLGYGFKSFTKIVPLFYYPRDNSWIETNSSHNDYFDILVRGGLVYSLAFWTFIFYILSRGFHLANSSIDPHVKRLLLYLSSSLVIILVAAVFQNPMKDPIISYYFWTVIATISYYWRNYSHVKR